MHCFLFPRMLAILRISESRCDVLFFFNRFMCIVDEGNVIQHRAFIGLAVEPRLLRQVRMEATVSKTLPHACQETTCVELSGRGVARGWHTGHVPPSPKYFFSHSIEREKWPFSGSAPPKIKVVLPPPPRKKFVATRRLSGLQISLKQCS